MLADQRRRRIEGVGGTDVRRAIARHDEDRALVARRHDDAVADRQLRVRDDEVDTLRELETPAAFGLRPRRARMPIANTPQQ